MLLVLLMLVSIAKLSAEEVKTYLYKGSIDKFPVTLYLHKEVSGCGPVFYKGMYK